MAEKSGRLCGEASRPHTHASLMLQTGVHPKVVSERLGHASIAITMDTYSHVLPGLQEEGAELFSELVAPSMRE